MSESEFVKNIKELLNNNLNNITLVKDLLTNQYKIKSNYAGHVLNLESDNLTDLFNKYRKEVEKIKKYLDQMHDDLDFIDELFE